MSITQRSESTRRHILQGAAAGLALLATGCASTTGAAKPRVVVVGGGWGGLGAARTLAESGQVDVTLLEPNDSFMSCPLSVLYIAGLQPAQDFQRDYRQIDRQGIRRVRERAKGIDRPSRTVITDSQKIPYDFLVLSPGVEYMEDTLPGFAEGRDQLPIGFRAFEQSAVKKQVDTFLDKGGNLVMTAPKPPYRCPPAPYERAFLIAEQMKRRGTKGKIVFVDANPNPMPQPIAKPILHAMQTLYANQIEYLTNTDLTRVDAGKKVLSTSQGDVPYTAINIVLPMRAPALVRQAGLGERWAAVKLPSFQSQADPLVYVIGDAQGSPLPKSGHVAFGAGQQVANDILQHIGGKAVVPVPGSTVGLPNGICWAKVSESSAIMINVSASLEVGQAPKLSFQVDPQHNATSSKGSRDWGQMMWKSMLG
jgi:sulfide dehydrogenase [flavocytochrome c] flavoprotein chain